MIITFLFFIQNSWSCDPGMGTPNRIFPLDGSTEVSLDTHILLEIIGVAGGFEEYNLVVSQETEI